MARVRDEQANQSSPSEHWQIKWQDRRRQWARPVGRDNPPNCGSSFILTGMLNFVHCSWPTGTNLLAHPELTQPEIGLRRWHILVFTTLFATACFASGSQSRIQRLRRLGDRLQDVLRREPTCGSRLVVASRRARPGCLLARRVVVRRRIVGRVQRVGAHLDLTAVSCAVAVGVEHRRTGAEGKDLVTVTEAITVAIPRVWR